MDERALRRIREKIRSGEYVVTTHADDEMYEDGLTIHDVERAVTTGQIVERQKDRHSSEWKYVIHGASLDSEAAAVVVKLGFTGKVVILTVYRP
jgi:hypothetical protein